MGWLAGVAWGRALLTAGALGMVAGLGAAASVVVRAGHHLRLDVSSSEYPTFELDPDTGGRITHDTEVAVARQRIFHDPQHPSRVILPIIPAS